MSQQEYTQRFLSLTPPRPRERLATDETSLATAPDGPTNRVSQTPDFDESNGHRRVETNELSN
jgi:hypothetical protein